MFCWQNHKTIFKIKQARATDGQWSYREPVVTFTVSNNSVCSHMKTLRTASICLHSTRLNCAPIKCEICLWDFSSPFFIMSDSYIKRARGMRRMPHLYRMVIGHWNIYLEMYKVKLYVWSIEQSVTKLFYFLKNII